MMSQSGSAAANAISQYILALLLFAYIVWRGLHKATWGGQSSRENDVLFLKYTNNYSYLAHRLVA